MYCVENWKEDPFKATACYTLAVIRIFTDIYLENIKYWRLLLSLI